MKPIAFELFIMDVSQVLRIKSTVFSNLIQIPGWKSKRKIVVIESGRFSIIMKILRFIVDKSYKYVQIITVMESVEKF